MYFLHAPKLVLTGSSPSLGDVGDRAAALGAEVLVLGPAPVVEPDAVPALGELDGFDVAVVATEVSSGPSEFDLRSAASLLAPGLREGALVIVSSPVSVEPCGRRLAAELAERSGLEIGLHFDVVGVEGDVVTWSTGGDGAEVARYLMSRLG